MKRAIIYLSIFLITLSGCNRDGKKAGYFTLTAIQNPDFKSANVNYKSANTKFSLGDVKDSKEFYFLIANGGENSIFDVMLSTDNSQFIIAPENISLLPGSNSKGSNNIIPLVSLGVLHGIQLNGIGSAGLLPMGENSAELTITGKTIENGDTIDLESTFVFNVKAKVMDIELANNGQPIDLNNPTGGSGLFGNLDINRFIRIYEVTSGTLEVKNVGNVDITLRPLTFDENGKRKDLSSISLFQNHTESVSTPQSQTSFLILEFDSDGTITNDSHIQLSSEGKGYIAFLLK